MIKIAAPLSHPCETSPLIRAGADEIFCGLHLSTEPSSHGNEGLNRRGGMAANLASAEALQQVVSVAHGLGVPVFLALNTFYSNPALAVALEQVRVGIQAGVDALIISDLGLLDQVRRNWPEQTIHLSVGGTVFNSESLAFFQQQGVTRINLPRHLSLEEMANISAHRNGVELEVLIQNDRCQFVDGFCNFTHDLPLDSPFNLTGVPHLRGILDLVTSNLPDWAYQALLNRKLGCRMSFQVNGNKTDSDQEAICRRIRDHRYFDACGVCAIADLAAMEIAAVKICGRSLSLTRRLRDVAFLARVRDRAGQAQDQAVWRQQTRRIFREIHHHHCVPSQCYYPVVEKSLPAKVVAPIQTGVGNDKTRLSPPVDWAHPFNHSSIDAAVSRAFFYVPGGPWPDDPAFRRIYFGNEWCQWLLPAPEQLKSWLYRARDSALVPTLVTPYFTDAGLALALPLLDLLAQIIPGAEVLIHDWGLLNQVKQRNLVPILGRAFSRQIRDPRIAPGKPGLHPLRRSQYRLPNLNDHFAAFLLGQGIGRLELDWPLQGMELPKEFAPGLKFSLYLPFGVITTTRMCPANSTMVGKSPVRGIGPCTISCQNQAIPLKAPRVGANLFIKGNTLFYQTQILPPAAIWQRVDRVVIQPMLPIGYGAGPGDTAFCHHAGEPTPKVIQSR